MKPAHVKTELADRWQRWADAAMAGLATGHGPDLEDLDEHLAACAECRAEADAWSAAFGGLAAEARAEGLPPADFLADVLAALPAESPLELAARADAAAARGRGLAWAAAACTGITATFTVASLIWAPGWLAQVAAAVLGWSGFWLQVFARAAHGMRSLVGQYQLLLLLYPAQAAAGALLMVGGWTLYAIYRIRSQTLAAAARMES